MSIHVPDIETFTRAHPDTQFVDVLLPDLLSTPRGKRLKFDLADLRQVCLGGQCSSAAGAAADDLRRSS